MDETAYQKIEGHETLISIFGRWPSFHDAEVLRLSFDLDQGLTGLEPYPSIETDIHIFQMTSEVDERGFYVLKNHTLLTLRFMGVKGVEMEGFAIQNVLWSLSIQDISERQMESCRFAVSFNASAGLSMGFECVAIRVVAVVPCAKDPLAGERFVGLPMAISQGVMEDEFAECRCIQLPDLMYYDERPQGFRDSLIEAESAAWSKLYQCRSCEQFWRIDNPDKYVERYIARLPSEEGWVDYDTTPLQKELLLQSRGGTSIEECFWSGCSNRCVVGTAWCVEHLYGKGVRR